VKHLKLSKTSKKIAKSYGYNPFFASRDTVEEAHDYAQELLGDFKDLTPIGIITAMTVVSNTLINEIAFLKGEAEEDLKEIKK
jgi:hypothetical protein